MKHRAQTCLRWLVAGWLALAALLSAQAAPGSDALRVDLPDVSVTDQDGRERRFTTDLLKGRTVAINFVFTTCTSICTPLGAAFKSIQDELQRSGASDVHLISVSVDPLNDTPEAMRAFGQKFGAGKQWTLVTGGRRSIDAILKAFGVGSSLSDPNDHSPMIFLGHVPSARWSRAYGLSDPATIARQLMTLRTAPASAAAAPNTAAATQAPALTAVRQAAADLASRASPVALPAGSRGAAYFTNLPLLTQDRAVRFYDDLIRDRVVLIHSFYANCRDICSPLSFNLAQAQRQLAEQVRTPVQVISISTDPLADVPEVLREYAARHGAGPGWAFVTGKKENVDWVLHKLGLYQEAKEAHTAVLWVGNDRTGTWLKLHAMAPPEAIVQAVRKVL